MRSVQCIDVTLLHLLTADEGWDVRLCINRFAGVKLVFTDLLLLLQFYIKYWCQRSSFNVLNRGRN